jgi:hypothetical protein
MDMRQYQYIQNDKRRAGVIFLALAYPSQSWGSRRRSPPAFKTAYILRKNEIIPLSPPFKWIHFVIENLRG